VVFDASGCAGAERRLDWLSQDDVRTLGERGELPVLHPTTNGRADLELWRSDDGDDLVVVAEVTWGDRISG
jgi:hypothetical protein